MLDLLREELRATVRERDAALLSLDEGRIRAYMQRMRLPIPARPEVFWTTVHKARVADRNLPAWARNLSRLWLLGQGSREMD